jgi:hypothetical protein
VDLPVRVRKEGAKRGAERKATSLSQGGVKLILPEAIPAGTRLKLEFRLEEGEAPLETIGEIRWCLQEKDGFGAGFDFIGADDAFRAAIERYRTRLDERRQHPREATRFRVKLQASSIDAFAKSYAADVSVGGMRLSVGEVHLVGDRLRLEFQLPIDLLYETAKPGICLLQFLLAGQ